MIMTPFMKDLSAAKVNLSYFQKYALFKHCTLLELRRIIQEKFSYFRR